MSSPVDERGFPPAEHVPDTPVDAGALRRWAGAALAVLGRSREEIDALNVFPIADADTGTNMYLTFEAACRALDDRLGAPGPAPSVVEALQALAHGALLGARGNSGVILSQLLRGAAGARYAGPAVDGAALATGLAAASELAYEAVARPAEGTILSVASAAAEAASAAAVAIGELAADRASTGNPLGPNDSLAYVAQAAAAGARQALAETPDHLEVLRRAGVVDAGGLGLVVILETLAAYTGGIDPRSAFRQRRLSAARIPAQPAPPTPRPEVPRADPAFEVIYLLDAPDPAVTGPTGLRAALDTFCEQGNGDSLVVVGGDGLWRIHVHVDDAGFPIEAAIAVGTPRDIQINHLASQPGAPLFDHSHAVPTALPPRPTRAVVAVAYGVGLAELFEEAGAQVIRATEARPPSAADFERAVQSSRAAEVVLVANDAESAVVAAAVAERLSDGSRRVAAIPAKVTVQGIAALAVHEPSRRFDADVVAMTAAAGATRYGAVEIATTEAWTMAGVCRPGQLLGHIENDVALIADDQVTAVTSVLERMLSAGGEMVTLVIGDGAEPGLPQAVADWVGEHHPVVDVVAYEGGQAGFPLLIGVE